MKRSVVGGREIVSVKRSGGDTHFHPLTSPTPPTYTHPTHLVFLPEGPCRTTCEHPHALLQQIPCCSVAVVVARIVVVVV